jgi:hypothetical protein
MKGELAGQETGAPCSQPIQNPGKVADNHDGLHYLTDVALKSQPKACIKWRNLQQSFEVKIKAILITKSFHSLT